MDDREGVADSETIALCLSGGGYRAMLFHLGTLWRLNELAYLPKLARVSSVSGGSITAGVLALCWDELSFDEAGMASDFAELVGAPLHDLANRTIDASAALRGTFWFGSIGNKVAAAYRKHLFGTASLQDLPDDPRFVFNATNLQSGALWRFSKPYMADYKVGQVISPEVELAVAVAASSAFPPFLSPLELKLPAGAVVGFEKGEPPLHKEPYTRKAVLSDGGVYDNLGLETAQGACDILLVSDGGGRLKPEKDPPGSWPLHTLRVLSVIDSQVRARRTIGLIDEYARRRKAGKKTGALWTIRTPIAEYTAPDTLPIGPVETCELAATKTRLAKLGRGHQERLVNWGYAACDAAMRTYVEPAALAPASFPYPEASE